MGLVSRIILGVFVTAGIGSGVYEMTRFLETAIEYSTAHHRAVEILNTNGNKGLCPEELQRFYKETGVSFTSKNLSLEDLRRFCGRYEKR